MPGEDKRNPLQQYAEDSLQTGRQNRRRLGQTRDSPMWNTEAPPTALERFGRAAGNAFNDAGASMMSRHPLRQLDNQRYREKARQVMIEEQRQRDAYTTQRYRERLAQMPGPSQPDMPMPEGSHNWTAEEHALWRQAMAARVKREQDYNASRKGQ